MKVLVLHNRYIQRGGEDECFEAETAMLTEAGHEVLTYQRDNATLLKQSRLKSAINTLWSQESYREVQALLVRHRPDIMHVHNSFPLISPSVLHAAHQMRVPTVIVLSNYRLFCPSGIIHRRGQRCTTCRGKTIAWPGVLHACYRDSRLATGAVAAQQLLHRKLGTWNKVDRFIAVSEATRQEYIKAGFPPERIAVKPNFVKDDPGPGSGSGQYALFVGRLTEEKGVRLLLEAWSEDMPLPLKIVGTGPLANEVGGAGANVQALGEIPLAEVLELMKEATVTIVPSLWPEPFGRVVAESYACGTPVLAAPYGALKNIVKPGQTGWHFDPTADNLRTTLSEIYSLPPSDYGPTREGARAEFEAHYSSGRNLQMLLDIYRDAQRHREGQKISNLS